MQVSDAVRGAARQTRETTMADLATMGATLSRRMVLGGLAGSLAWGAAGPALALSADAAKSHVRAAVDAVLALVQAGGDDASKARELEAVLGRYAAMPQIARFAAGVAWRDMSESEQADYTAAFSHYLSVQYARRFQDYSGQTVELGRVREGKRGLTVASSVTQPNGQPVEVDWLVTDRPGRTVIADIVIEGVSLLVQQREEIAAIYASRGSVGGLIAALKSA